MLAQREDGGLRPALAVGLVSLGAVAVGVAIVGLLSLATGDRQVSEPQPRPIADRNLDPSRPVWVRKGSVVCPAYAVTDAFLAGQKAAGEAEGHSRVARLFINPSGTACYRTLGIERVEVTDPHPFGEHLIQVRPLWRSDGLTDDFEVLPSSLEN